jgi:hypothetical protein
LNTYSEFAGLAYDEQLQKIERGKEILEKNIWMTIKRWMAPAHSFDKDTCKALKKAWFAYITDGIALYPFEKHGLKWLPQQIWRPTKKCIGIWTICLHINNFKEKDIKGIESFIKGHQKDIIQDIEHLSYNNKTIKKIINATFKPIFWAKIYLYRIKTKLLW